MASNPYINNFTSNNEQTLMDNLVAESIAFYGLDVKYLPRHGVNPDSILNENEYSSFTTYADVEVYVKNFASFGGDGNFLSKFGLEVRDQVTLVMSHKSFNTFVNPVTSKSRPLEGDLIYLPITNACYQISYVETAATFYQLGKLQSYEIKCEVFEYSNEVFNTGLPLDAVYAKYDTTVDIDNDKFNQNEEVQDYANTVLDWSESSPFGDF